MPQVKLVPLSNSLTRLTVWSASIDLVVALYALSVRFPPSERYGLVSQIRRAAVSIPANLAEGNSRLSDAANLQHVNIALGSLGELRALIEIAGKLELLAPTDQRDIEQKLDGLGKLLYGLRLAIKRRVDEERGTKRRE